MRQPSLMPEPVVRLFREFTHAPALEELWRTAFRCRLFRNRLHSVLAILVERPLLIRIWPRASRTIGPLKLVEVRQSRYTSNNAGLFDRELRCLQNGLQTGRHARGLSDSDSFDFDRWLRTSCAPARSFFRNFEVRHNFGFTHRSLLKIGYKFTPWIKFIVLPALAGLQYPVVFRSAFA